MTYNIFLSVALIKWQGHRRSGHRRVQSQSGITLLRTVESPAPSGVSEEDASSVVLKDEAVVSTPEFIEHLREQQRLENESFDVPLSITLPMAASADDSEPSHALVRGVSSPPRMPVVAPGALAIRRAVEDDAGRTTAISVAVSMKLAAAAATSGADLAVTLPVEKPQPVSAMATVSAAPIDTVVQVTLLREATKGSRAGVAAALAAGALPNVPDAAGITALHAAATGTMSLLHLNHNKNNSKNR
jgi:hypothetical protein